MNDVNRTSAIKIIILPKGKMKMSKIWQFFFALSLLVTSLSVLSGCSKPDAQSKRDQTKQATCEKCFHYLAICVVPTVPSSKIYNGKIFLLSNLPYFIYFPPHSGSVPFLYFCSCAVLIYTLDDALCCDNPCFEHFSVVVYFILMVIC